MYVRMCACVCIYLCMCVYMCVHVCVYMCACVCVSVCMCGYAQSISHVQLFATDLPGSSVHGMDSTHWSGWPFPSPRELPDSGIELAFPASPALQKTWVLSWGWEDPRKREWLPTPVFLPGESRDQWSLVDYGP